MKDQGKNMGFKGDGKGGIGIEWKEDVRQLGFYLANKNLRILSQIVLKILKMNSSS